MGPSASTVTVGATFVTITSNVSNDSSPAASLKSRWIVTVPSSGTVKLNVGSVPTCTVVIALVNDQSNVYGIGPEALALAVTGVPSPTVSGPSGFMAAGIVCMEASNTRLLSSLRTMSGADFRRREFAPRRRRWGAGENQDSRMGAIPAREEIGSPGFPAGANPCCQRRGPSGREPEVASNTHYHE